jgi:hypothetical protein
VGLDDLRLLELSYWDLDAVTSTGRLVVHRQHAEAVLRAFRQLFEARFPIERMELVDAFAADDDASMAANNTSAFNCRTVSGTSSWSEHAYGHAVDVNPRFNPWVTGGRVEPANGRRARLRGHRLGLGRHVLAGQGLPALLRDRAVIPSGGCGGDLSGLCGGDRRARSAEGRHRSRS